MKLWKGRFSKEATSFVNEWAASIDFDQILYKEDIEGSLAHANMLAKQGIIGTDDAELIISGLHEILEDIEGGRVEFDVDTEDIHMNIEALLTEKIGDAGKKLHTGRSRNDQVATDLRIFQKENILETISLIKDLKEELVKLAKGHQDTVMPGYTHLQRAQPITFAFHLMAYYQMLKRDGERFWDCYKRTDILPLGSGAMSGTTYSTDREYLREELDFGMITDNAMDSVSDRDFVLEYMSAASITMMHLSRFCEELILWSSTEFAFIEMDDSFSTGSSIMPQKKNPDMAELIRGKTGRVYGNLMNLLTIMKGLPLAYNKDMQEDKPPLFDTVDTLTSCLKVFREMIGTMTVNKDRTERAAKSGFMNATDAADYLVKKGVPFRDCHEIIGKLVLYCIENNMNLDDISLDEFKQFSDKFEKDIYDHIDIRACIDAKVSVGSTSKESVKKQIDKASNELNN
jgi:argininosuccinate lyase